MSSRATKRAAVLVLGDLGRSPRMLNHVLSLVREGWNVDLVGRAGTALPTEVRAAAGVTVWPLPSKRSRPGRGALTLAALALGSAWEALRAANVLLRRTPPFDAILVQAPPGIPSVPVAWLVARVRGAALVIDWHNLGWTVLALRLGSGHPAVRGLARVELAVARRANAHVAVSRAMAERLDSLGVGDAIVVHDGARAAFGAAAAERKNGVATSRAGAGSALAVKSASTVGSASHEPSASAPPEAPAAVVATLVCPMGWTADDDLELLESALRRYDERWADRSLPLLRVLLTGTGPLKDTWTSRLARREMGRVRVETPFVPADEYPSLLASADLGLSLHRSSSGVDLPIKIVEMHACGLPVLALDYGIALREIVDPDVDTLLFRTADELAERLAEALTGFGTGDTLLVRLAAGVRSRGSRRWHDEWRDAVLPMLAPDGRS